MNCLNSIGPTNCYTINHKPWNITIRAIDIMKIVINLWEEKGGKKTNKNKTKLHFLFGNAIFNTKPGEGIVWLYVENPFCQMDDQATVF